MCQQQENPCLNGGKCVPMLGDYYCDCLSNATGRNCERGTSVQLSVTTLDVAITSHHIPLLRQLHWLPVRGRVSFKVACLIRQSLFGQAPLYLADDRCLVSDSSMAIFVVS